MKKLPPRSGLNPHPIFRFAIEDTGLGIPEADVERIFTPFTQVHRNQRKSDGSGLGLSIAKKIVGALSGEMGVTSRVGVGSTFWIELPLENLPPATLFPSLEASSFQTKITRGALAAFFGCRDPQAVETPPKISIGICSKGRSLDIFSHYFGYWGVEMVILRTEGDIGKFVLDGRSLFLVDDDLDNLAHIFRLLGAKQASRGDHDQPEEEASRVVVFSPLSVLSTFIRAVTAGQDLAKTGVVTKPIDPLKVAMAILFLLGYDVRFNVGRTEDSASSPGAIRSSAIGMPPRRLSAPNQEGQKSSSQEALKPPSPLSSSPVPSQQIEVLVVEDNFVNQMIMKKQLEKLKVEFEVTPSAEEGVRIWDALKEPIPIILMDVEVEGALNGLQATSLIRAHEAERSQERERQGLLPLPRSYIAVMTGRAMEEDKQEALACGCDEFLTKPVSLNLIRDLVRTHLHRNN